MTRSLAAGCAVLAAVALAAVPGGAYAAAPPASGAEVSRSALQAAADAIVAAGAPGVEVAVEDEYGSWNGVSGIGDLRTGEAPDSGGPLRIGSITKSLTATMVMQLVAERRVELDAPIGEYLPGLLPYEEPITVAQLLQHTSGLHDYKEDLWPDVRAVRDGRYRTYTPEQLVAVATAYPLESVPGTAFAYSNTGYIVLGMLIEKVTGRSVESELRSRVLRPAGMRDTYLAGAFPFLPDPAMRGYESLDGRMVDLTSYDMSVSWTTGALVSTSDDVNRFYAALLGGRLLPAEQLARMERTVEAFPGFGYGLGLAGGEFCGRRVWGHVGARRGTCRTRSRGRTCGGR